MSNQCQQKPLLVSPPLSYIAFFRSSPCLLGKVITKYTINDFDGIILLCAYYILAGLSLVEYLLEQDGRAFLKMKLHSHCVGVIVLLALASLALLATPLCYLSISLSQELLSEGRIISAENVLLARFFRDGTVVLTDEKLFHRGVLTSTYFKHSRCHLDILVSAICFASVYVIRSSWSWFNFVQYIPAGLSLGLIFEQTEPVCYPTLLRFLVNYGPKTISMILT